MLNNPQYSMFRDVSATSMILNTRLGFVFTIEPETKPGIHISLFQLLSGRDHGLIDDAHKDRARNLVFDLVSSLDRLGS